MDSSFFSLCGPVVLALALLGRARWRKAHLWSLLGYIVGGVSILVGCAGVIYHLDSQFFFRRVNVTYLKNCAAVLIGEAGMGGARILSARHRGRVWPFEKLLENVLSGAPPLAPLLFPHLAVPGLIALWVYRNRLPASGPVNDNAVRDNNSIGAKAVNQRNRTQLQ